MKSYEEIKKEAIDNFWDLTGKEFEENEIAQLEKDNYVIGYCSGYDKSLKDNKDKKYTRKDLINAFNSAREETFYINLGGEHYDQKYTLRSFLKEIDKDVK